MEFDRKLISTKNEETYPYLLSKLFPNYLKLNLAFLNSNFLVLIVVRTLNAFYF